MGKKYYFLNTFTGDNVRQLQRIGIDRPPCVFQCEIDVWQKKAKEIHFINPDLSLTAISRLIAEDSWWSASTIYKRLRDLN